MVNLIRKSELKAKIKQQKEKYILKKEENDKLCNNMFQNDVKFFTVLNN